MKAASWRIADLERHLDVVLAWLRDEAPHVIFLQGVRADEGAFPFTAFYDAGYYTKVHGASGGPELAVLGLEPPKDVRRSAGGGRFLAARVAGIRVLTVDGASETDAAQALRGVTVQEAVLLAGRLGPAEETWRRAAGLEDLSRLAESGDGGEDVFLASPSLARRCAACRVVPVSDVTPSPRLAIFRGLAVEARPPGVLPA